MLLRLLRKLLLRKEIVSQQGQVHFRRWGVETKYFSVLLHNIRRSDEDKDPHDHPWPFFSFILWGGYHEKLWQDGADNFYEDTFKPGRIIYRKTTDFHKLTLRKGPAWTFVLAGPRTHENWGYKTSTGWVDHVTYRKRKNALQRDPRNRPN